MAILYIKLIFTVNGSCKKLAGTRQTRGENVWLGHAKQKGIKG
jgi:hypothetical protein